jgi:hypothetical protein
MSSVQVAREGRFGVVSPILVARGLSGPSMRASPSEGIEVPPLRHAPLPGLSAAWVSARGFLPTGCRSLVCGIWLALLRAGDLESNPGPDGGPCVGCGLTPAANTRALLWCREGCGRECHRKEACSGLRRGEQHQGIWALGANQKCDLLMRTRITIFSGPIQA